MSKLLVGLTGGIASGKTAVSTILAELGCEIIDTDLIAREVVEPGQPALAKIDQHFGSAVIDSNGCLNRAVLREIVFAQPREREWLEQLLHPLIRKTALDRATGSEKEVAVLVVPLLFESGQYQQTDMNLVVDIPTSLQRERVLARDGVNEAQVEKILAAQMDRQERLNRADYVIENSGTLAELEGQVETFYKTALLPRLRGNEITNES